MSDRAADLPFPSRKTVLKLSCRAHSEEVTVMFGGVASKSLVWITVLGLIFGCDAAFGETVRKTYKIKGFS